MEDAQAALAGFPERLRTASWFAMAGEPLSPAEQGDLRTYLDSLGLAADDMTQVAGWPEAEACIKNTDWDDAWWAAEERLRTTLLAQAEDRFGEVPAMQALSHIAEQVSEVVHGAAAIAASRSGIADQGLTRAAAGAATMACYQAAVEVLAGVANGRPFAAKLRLFEAGHWPLCMRAGNFFIF